MIVYLKKALQRNGKIVFRRVMRLIMGEGYPIVKTILVVIVKNP